MSINLVAACRLKLAHWALAAGVLSSQVLGLAQEFPGNIPPAAELLPQQVVPLPSTGVKFKVQAGNERLEITVNESRVVEFPFEVPKMLLNNPDLVRVVPISPKSIQISALKPGVTQLNVWSLEDKVTSIDVIILGDVKELDMTLKTLFPDSDIRLRPLNNALYMSGFVPKAENVARIERVAKTFFPEIINDLSVGGVHKVQLHVKVMEVSRTKLRDQGFDWQQISSGSYVGSGAAGLLGAGGSVNTSGNAATIQFGVVDGNNKFFAFLQFLEKKQLAKLLSEPTLTTISGRPASFNSGGEIPIAVPQALGVTTVQFREFGTQIDFVPVVLGNGNVRLEVLTQVTEIDPSLAISLGSGSVPGFRQRRADTAMEMKAGQTMAIAGIVYNRLDSTVRGIPVLADLPGVGMAFRRTTETNNEVELIVLVTPEFTEAMDATEVPPCGPGQTSTMPSDAEMYLRGYQEVPKGCANGNCPTGTLQGGYGVGGTAESFANPNGQTQMAPPPNSARRANYGSGSQVEPRMASRTSTTTGRPTTANPGIGGSSSTVGKVTGTVRAPGSTMGSSSVGRSPQNPSNSYFGNQLAKPSSSAKPTLIGPSGYDEIRR